LLQVILKRYDVDPALLDDMLQESTRSAMATPTAPTARGEAVKLTAALADARVLDDRFIIQALRNGRITAVVAALSLRCGISEVLARRILLDVGGETLAIACRSIGMDRSSFGTVFLLSRQGRSRAEHPSALRNILAFFDAASEQKARGVIRYWRSDQEYLAAIAAFSDTPDRTQP